MPSQSIPSLTYDVVVVTKDRPGLLRYSVPSILNQTIAPNRLIIVDASADHEATIDVVEECRRNAVASVDVAVLPFRPSQTAQRNEGLRHVTAPVVFIPDDDSILLPDAAEHVMRVYERDEEGKIGGIGMKETRTPPPALRTDEAQSARNAGLADRIVYRFAGWKAHVLDYVAENPLHAACRALMDAHAPPDWLASVDATPTPFLHGFRMTYRTEVVRKHGFNESYARGWGLDDFDVSLSVMQTHMLVDANRAFVYHHRTGGKRDKPLETGVTQVLNPCYITCRHMPPGSAARRAVRPYALRLVVDYAMRAHTTYGRARLCGILRARKRLPELLAASPEELTPTYRSLFEQCQDGAGR